MERSKNKKLAKFNIEGISDKENLVKEILKNL